jgi:hypothetical protein
LVALNQYFERPLNPAGALQLMAKWKENISGEIHWITSRLAWVVCDYVCREGSHQYALPWRTLADSGLMAGRS